MRNVQVRDVPDEVHEALVRRADEAGQSLQQFLSRRLAEIAATPTIEEILERIERRPKVASVLRRHASNGNLTPEQAEVAISDLLDFPIAVYPTAPLLRRVWELRSNVTAYDGCYVALAEAAGLPLLTADRRLANAPDLRCPVELL